MHIIVGVHVDTEQRIVAIALPVLVSACMLIIDLNDLVQACRHECLGSVMELTAAQDWDQF
jgi:hypothetical protein